MPFTSLTFLFLFLPLTLVVFYLVPVRAKPGVVAFASLFFLAWAKLSYVPVMIISVLINRALGVLIARNRGSRSILALAVVFNLLVLVLFKYSGFLCSNLNSLLHFAAIPELPVPSFLLPLGISFYTFRIISYHIDLQRNRITKPASHLNLFTYMAFFPQLGAGPIVRYPLFTATRWHVPQKTALFYNGIRRFLYGLMKKVLIANTIGLVSDAVFALPPEALNLAVSWLGAVSYGMQVYFDFSAYTDMAIGLSMCLGYAAPENFNFPYRARSVKDFWTRWHMSLTDWFRDYLFLPLAFRFSRKMPAYRTMGLRTDLLIYLLSIFITWILVGFWHGADWTFIAWGLWFGFFLAVEQAGFRKILRRSPRFIQHSYTLLIILIAWIFFRSGTFTQGTFMIRGLLGLNGMESGSFDWYKHLNPTYVIAMVIAITGAAGLLKSLRILVFKQSLRFRSATPAFVFRLSDAIILIGLLLVSVAEILRIGYSPFIYFKF